MPNGALQCEIYSDETNTVEVTTDQVYKSIFSFRNGSAGGIDGLSPQHLKDLLSINNGITEMELLQSITNLCNMMLAGEVNKDFLNIVYGALLIALMKKNGGIRPIAIGCTLRRLVSKLACKAVAVKLSIILKPKQIGFFVKGGCEAAVHATRTFIEYSITGEIIVKVDVRNAFNSVLRDKMLQKIKKTIPEIYPYLYQCYANHSNLFLGDWIMLSALGCQQGDPLGPPIFCLTINECIQELKSDLNLWYLDDGTLGGRGETVINDLTHIKQNFSLLGLELNHSKCEVYFLPHVQNERKIEIMEKLNLIVPGITILNENNLTLLGAPLTKEEKMTVISSYFNKLRDLHPHVALVLLKHCLWIPKFMYLLRCCPLFKFSTMLKQIDKEIKKTLEMLLNIELDINGEQQCFLPINNGGIGIRLLTDLALPAYIASVHSTSELITEILTTSIITFEVHYLNEAMVEWKLLCPNIEVPTIKSIQHNWDSPMIIAKVELLTNISMISIARILAVTQEESGAWSKALPSPYLGTLLDKESLRIAIGLRLGIKICHPYTCICGFPVNAFGTHGLSCNKSIGRWSRDFNMNDIIKRGVATTGVPAKLEPLGLIREDGKRADGITLTPWSNGRCLVWDATCVDTLAPSYIASTSKVAAAAANKAVIKKEKLYSGIIVNHHFVAFAAETMGSFSESANFWR